MTVNEFKGWSKVTESSKTRWVVDEITLHNKNVYLMYIGGVDGKYIRIEKDGTLECGNYEGAIPHIGEAEFTTTFTKKFNDQNAALQRCFEVGGMRFLRNFMGVN